MHLVLEQLTKQTIHETAEVRIDSFEGSPAQKALRPQVRLPSVYEWMTQKHTKQLAEPGSFFIGVRDQDTGELAAYGHWQRDNASDRAEAALEHQDEGPEEYAEGSNPAAQAEFGRCLNISERGLMGDTDYWHLHMLGTKKKYVRNGAARMILQWGLEHAQADGLPAYLDSTEAGRPAYDSMGFEPGPEWNLDLNQYGVDHWNRQWPMKWMPKAQSSYVCRLTVNND